MDNDNVIREKFAKATDEKDEVEKRVEELKEMGALDVELTENDLFWIITFRLP